MNEGGFDLVTASGDAALRLVAGKTRPADQHRPHPELEERRRRACRTRPGTRSTACTTACPISGGRTCSCTTPTSSRARRRRAGTSSSRRELCPTASPTRAACRPIDGADLHRRRGALPEGQEARARHQGSLRAQRGPVQGGARRCCASSASWSAATGTTPRSRSTTSTTRASSPRLLAVPGQPAAGRQAADRLDRSRRRRHRLGRHHDDARRRAAPELRLPVDGALARARRCRAMSPPGSARCRRCPPPARATSSSPTTAARPTASTTSTRSLLEDADRRNAPRQESLRPLLALGRATTSPSSAGGSDGRPSPGRGALEGGDEAGATAASRPILLHAGCSRHSCTCRRRVGLRPRAERRRHASPSRSAGVERHFGAGARPSTASTSTSRRASSSPCSGRPARARRPACG